MLKREHVARLVLGMRSTDPVTDATVALARSTKRLKTLTNAPFDIKDLTAALSQLEGHATDEVAFEFKVPANTDLVNTDLSKRPEDADAHASLTSSIDTLLRWDWLGAKKHAKDALSQTHSEDIRDEALNVIAAASALLGDLDAAKSALQRAVEGEWNFALQQNLGILALETDPELAAQQSTYWLDAASTTGDRERALFFVLKMWSNLESDDDDDVEIPQRIRESFRSALNEELTASTFVTLGLFLARNDSEWTKQPINWVRSPHFTSDIGSMVLARAEGLDSFVDFLSEHATNSDPEITQARENMISQLVEAMMERDSAIGAASVAIKFVESGLPCDTLNSALLRPLAVREICLYLQDEEGEAKDEFVDWLLEFKYFAQSLDDEDLRDFVHDMLVNASKFFIFGYAEARNAEFQVLSEPLGTVYQLSRNWGTRRQLNKPEARRLAIHVQQWAARVQYMINKFASLAIEDGDVEDLISDLNDQERKAAGMAKFILEKN